MSYHPNPFRDTCSYLADLGAALVACVVMSVFIAGCLHALHRLLP